MNPPSLDLNEERNKLIKDTLLEILEGPEGYEIISQINGVKRKLLD